MSLNYYGQRSVPVSAFGIDAIVSVEFEVFDGVCEVTAMWVDGWTPKDAIVTGPQHSELMRLAEQTFLVKEGWKNVLCEIPKTSVDAPKEESHGNDIST